MRLMNACSAPVPPTPAMIDSGCPFCGLSDERIVASSNLSLAFYDAFPVTPMHGLVIPRRHTPDFFSLTNDERSDCFRLLDTLKDLILRNDPTVEGFNIGANCGLAAGQTVFHCHVHLIPRRTGDVQRPRGGVRAVIPGRADY